MIASLHGEILSVTASQAVIEVAGVGYSVRMSGKDLASLHAGQDVRVLTTMSVSQDAITLFGFLHHASQELFAQLQKTSGIGPKVAMAILSTLSPQELLQAIRENNVTALTRAPGLGKKGAQKIIVELSGSVNLDALISEDGESDESAALGASRAKTAEDDFADSGTHQVLQGLMSLGWQQRDAVDAITLALEDLGLDADAPLDSAQVPVVLRHALTRLDRGR
ncbi:Holliday junction branch migration protein RuvA [Alloscardovia macacae]|uniref:Holliday junction branch migration complex subunit RuvA n=1 Tax=Alloscardovia macacae TaxID=1160091 RepID=A0A1Y2SYA5_9BIFI|nr:Holliday junction branch migration protein RuvA [Alloscardovia macacae]OTA27520.1 Holliday junction branch migration protein RuvA [Alloscardovia macacae]OTA30168.1 Holliday junction branch migration protein RuvA [Alloscardovia macacae]